MAEILKVWVVRDGAESDLDDPAIKIWPGDLEENILAQFMWEMDVDQFIHVVVGGGPRQWFDENSKIYDDAASARKDAEARIKKLREEVAARVRSSS